MIRALVCITVLTGCPGSPETPKTKSDPKAPTSVSYSGSPFTYTVGTQIETDLPIFEGGEPTAFAIAPALPGGITFDTKTGGIAGTPLEAVAKKSFTVTASNALGSAMGNVDIEVLAGPTAPTNLRYAFANASYVRNQAIPANTATVDGTAPFTFSIAPSLPSGFALDAVTGTISGTPTVLQTSQLYTVTVANAKGTARTAIQIAVTATLLPPDITGYSPSATLALTVGQAIDAAPVLAGGPPSNYTIAPTGLPSGVSFNTTTGHISGTPAGTFPSTNFTITASNAAGADTTPFVVSITATQPEMPTLSYAAATGATGYVTPGTKIIDMPALPAAAGRWTFSLDGTSDPLPSGVSLITSTGLITGTPTESIVAPRNHYVVRASNIAGSVTADVPLAFAAAPALSQNHEISLSLSTPGCPAVSGPKDIVVALHDSVGFRADTAGIWSIRVSLAPSEFTPLLLDNSAQSFGTNAVTTYVWTADHTAGLCGAGAPTGTITVQ